MIQRIQSLYLFLAAILYVLLFFFSMYEVVSSSPDQMIQLFLHKIVSIKDDASISVSMQYLPMIIGLLIIIFSLINIVLFKNRMLQSKICQFLLLLGTGLIVTLFFSLENVSNLAENKSSLVSAYKLPIIFTALPLIFYFLANKGIIKDEKMINSANRLR